MAFRIVKGDTVDIPATIVASQTVTAGGILQPDLTNKGLKIATSATTVQAKLFIANANLTSIASATIMNVVPVDSNMIFEADCTNVTATNQLFIRHLLTDANTVNNTSTDVAINTGVFYAIGISGGVGGTKLFGYLISQGQNNAAS